VSKLKLSIHIVCCTVIYSLITNLGSLFFPSSSGAADVRGPEIHYRSCAHLQKRMNNVNNPNIKFKGFERANLMKRTKADFAYMVYCNNGVIIDNEEKTSCYGYIGYAYFPELGIASYYGDWGYTDGSPNKADTGKERYCRRIK
jgi:hypothetical protein